ncbi:MAG: spermidine/putrescine ABC transporter substrate-binding protein [Acidimicrobiia bacterium]|nr:MAG: spermidine/putrescine ABC transporter substrate-binding protein [Acidimicrobiia bacterium]
MKTRRSLVLMACTLALILAGCGGADTAERPIEEQSLVISNWEGYMPDDLVPNFSEQFGVETTLTFHATNEEIVGKLVAAQGEGFDVVFVSGQFAQALAGQGLLAEIDHEQIPNAENLYDEVGSLGYDEGMQYSVPYAWGTTGLCYRSDLLDFEPDSWWDLLDPPAELSGKITMLATERWLMLPAQKALGFSVNTTDPDEMEQVKQVLIDAKQHLLAYDDTTFYSKLVSGEAWLVEAWDGWCNYGIAENPDIKYVIPQEGTDLWVDTMAILASSENKEAAHAFINYVLEPSIHSWVVENILYKTPNRAAMELVDPSLFETFPNLAMTPEELLQGEVLLDLGDAQPMYTQIATEVLAGS